MPTPDELSLFAGRLETIGAPYMITGATAAFPGIASPMSVVSGVGVSMPGLIGRQKRPV
jgi:hypothetical protein